jgi:hypothetical protein
MDERKARASRTRNVLQRSQRQESANREFENHMDLDHSVGNVYRFEYAASNRLFHSQLSFDQKLVDSNHTKSDRAALFIQS